MKTQTIFIADDGSRHDTKGGALLREVEIAQVRAAMSRLGELPKDDGCNFANGDGYYQHSLADLERVRVELFQIARPRLGECTISTQAKYGHTEEWIALNAHPSWFCRMLDDNSPLSRAYNRLLCIDKQGREWGQPYFASHPPQGAKQYERESVK